MTVITILLILLNIALLAAVGHVLYREVATIRITRQQQTLPQLPAGAATIRELQTQLESQHQTELERLRADARTTINELSAEVDHLHTDVATLHTDVSRLHAEVATLQGNLGSLPTEVERLQATLGSLPDEVERLRATLGSLPEGIERLQGTIDALPDEVERLHGSFGNLPAGVERIHGELATLAQAVQALSAHSTTLSDELASRPTTPAGLPDVISVSRTSGPTGAVAELYAQLARLEVAFLNLANPVLLPGEPFENATELPPEALRWESWKDIGDQTFGFAELYAAKRVLLDAGPRAAAGQFITGVRELLTARIYPAVAGASRFDRNDRAERVKAAIAEMGAAIETVRRALETAHENGQSRAEARESSDVV